MLYFVIVVLLVCNIYLCDVMYCVVVVLLCVVFVVVVLCYWYSLLMCDWCVESVFDEVRLCYCVIRCIVALHSVIVLVSCCVIVLVGPVVLWCECSVGLLLCGGVSVVLCCCVIVLLVCYVL